MLIRARAHAILGILVSFVLTVGLMSGTAAGRAQAAVPDVRDNPAEGVTSDVLPTAQINGVAWDHAIVGNIVYVAGEFTSTRPAGSALGQNESPRYNLMSYNLQTGAMTSWAPQVNGPIRAITASPDGSRIYIGGSFTSVNGQGRYRVAAFNTADGSLVANFAPVAGSDVFAIAATGSIVYLGGWFNAVNSVARRSLAAVSVADGSLLGWSPTTDGTVYGIGLTTARDRVLVAGNFTTVNGTPMKSMASIDSANGGVYPFAASTLLKNTGAKASMTSLKVVNDQVFSTGYSYGTGNFEGVVVANPYDGTIENMLDCHGDTYDSVPMNGLVYSVSHHHFCTNNGGFPEISPRRHYHADAFTLQSQGTVAPNSQSGSGYGNWAGQPAGAQVQWWNTWTPGGYTAANQAGWTVETSGDYLAIAGEFLAINGQAQQGLVRFGTRNVVPNPSVGPAGLKSETVPNLVSVNGTTIRGTFTASYDRDNASLTYKVIRSDKGEQSPVATLTADSTPWIRPTLSFTDADVIPGWRYTYYVVAVDRDGNSKACDSASVTASSSVDNYASAVLADSPTHYWRLDQQTGATSSPDIAGGKPLTLLGGVSPGAAGALSGNGNKASTFSGTTTGTSGTSSSESGPQTLSVELWFKTTSSSGGKLIGFGNSSTGSSSAYDRHLYMSNTGRLSFGVNPGGVKTITTTSTYRDGTWHYAVATLSSAGIKLYVDGKLQASDASAVSAQAYNGYWRVGGDKSSSSWANSGTSNYFAGSLDEVAVYPSELTPAQVSTHYSAGRTAVTGTPPTAAFTATPDDLAVSLDASASTDADGAIAAYGWEFGDGSRGRGAIASHSYAIPGTYTVKLTVVDNQGFSSTSSKSVTVSVDSQGGSLVAKDTFNRSQARWGTAAIGGSWTDSGASYFSTNGSMGLITLSKASSGPTAKLADLSAKDVTINSDVALDKVPAGGVYLHQLQARVNGTNAYKLVLRVETNGGIKLYLTRLVAGVETTLQTYTSSSFGYTAGQRLNLRFDVHGTAPTLLEGKVWTAGGPEPTVPTVRSTDSTAVLQSAGGTAITAYSAGGMTSLPLVASVDQYLVASFVDDNAAPAADFSTTMDGAVVAFDASASTDSDGTIESYVWNFGDGATGSGKSDSHTYAEAGTYPVRLTVTDDDGATDTATRSVTVTAPLANVKPTAVFSVSTSDRRVSVDASGSSDSDGSVVSYAWDYGDGSDGSGKSDSHTYAEAGTYSVRLTVTDDDGATDTATRSVTITATAAFVAKDAFARTISSGWGSADTGGAWTVNSASSFSTDGSSGVIRVTAGGTRQASLASTSAKDVSIVSDFSLDQAIIGGNYYHQVLARVSGASWYSLTARLETTGILRVYIAKTVSGIETTLKTTTISGFDYAAGERLKIRLDVSGGGVTTLDGRVWRANEAEPSSPTATVTDNTAALQAAGALALKSYAGSSMTSVPLTIHIGSFVVEPK